MPAKENKIDSVPAEEATLYERILWVRDRVTRIAKDATVQTGKGSYKAVTHDAVTAAIRPKMVQAGIVSWISCMEANDSDTGSRTKNGRLIVQHRARFAITFCSVHNSNDSITIEQYAYADDYGDKAPGKATSYAMKYALLKMFMIETGEEDEERVDPSEARAAILQDDEALLLDLFALAEEQYGSEELAAQKLESLAKRRFHVDNYGQILQTRFNDAVRSVRQDAAAMRERGELQ